MLLPVFLGQKYSYSYEPETGHYLLHDNEYKSQAYLQGDDARIFRKEIERIDELPEGEYKTRIINGKRHQRLFINNKGRPTRTAFVPSPLLITNWPRPLF